MFHKAFPEAELVGCDLSATMVSNGHRIAERMGLKIDFYQADARWTPFESESFDGIVMHAVAHEVPYEANMEIFKECYRLLKPGGDIVMSDPPPFSVVSPFQSVILDWESDHREEPYYSEAANYHWHEEWAKIGFENCEAYAIGKNAYPWINRARKPY